MSSVVISGDISGSVTLDAPSVAGTTVLTLPATSGTVVTTATSSGISGSAITTGTVGVSVGGTGQTTAAGAFNALNPMTTVGDIIYEGTGPAAARLGIGTEGQVLSVASGIPAWATVSSSPTTNQVLSATAGATAGAVGTYMFAKYDVLLVITFGSTTSGSNLRPTSGTSNPLGSAQSGTWRCMGQANGNEVNGRDSTLYLRIS